MATCGYPIPGKRKSRLICEAWAQGCSGGTVIDNTLRDGDAFFYGVDRSIEHIWRTILHDQTRTFYYCDNSYFDDTRQEYFRITKNMLQHTGEGVSDGERYIKQLGRDHSVAPWREEGRHIVVCEQSASFMDLPIGYEGDWLNDIVPALRRLTSREIRIRRWERDKAHSSNSLMNDLLGAHALVTWSSAAAITSVMAGVPIIAQGQCAAGPMSGSLLDIEQLPMPPRYNWLGVLADNQFTLDEMRSGYAWEKLNGS